MKWEEALSSTIEPLDPEVVSLCGALNKIPGIETIASCCGHGYAAFRIYFVAESIENLKPILERIDESEVWTMRVSMSTGNMEPYFVLDGKTGSYDEAEALAVELTAGKR
jgi:hypothetical protein